MRQKGRSETTNTKNGRSKPNQLKTDRRKKKKTKKNNNNNKKQNNKKKKKKKKKRRNCLKKRCGKRKRNKKNKLRRKVKKRKFQFRMGSRIPHFNDGTTTVSTAGSTTGSTDQTAEKKIDVINKSKSRWKTVRLN